MFPSTLRMSYWVGMVSSLIFFECFSHPGSLSPAATLPIWINVYLPSYIVLMLGNHFLGPFRTLCNYSLYLSINDWLSGLPIRLGILSIREWDVSELWSHSIFCYYVICKIVGLREVVICTSGYLIEEMLLWTSTTQDETYTVQYLLFRL